MPGWRNESELVGATNNMTSWLLQSRRRQGKHYSSSKPPPNLHTNLQLWIPFFSPCGLYETTGIRTKSSELDGQPLKHFATNPPVFLVLWETDTTSPRTDARTTVQCTYHTWLETLVKLIFKSSRHIGEIDCFLHTSLKRVYIERG